MSIGKANFCVRALVDKGILKVNAFCNNRNKRAYAYVLTPSGIEERARLTVRFLKRKLEEYEAIQKEIADLTEQAQLLHSNQAPEDGILPSSRTGSPQPSDGSRTPT